MQHNTKTMQRSSNWVVGFRCEHLGVSTVSFEDSRLFRACSSTPRFGGFGLVLANLFFPRTCFPWLSSSYLSKAGTCSPWSEAFSIRKEHLPGDLGSFQENLAVSCGNPSFLREFPLLPVGGFSQLFPEEFFLFSGELRCFSLILVAVS